MIKRVLTLVNALHITASVFINDDGSGLHHDYEVWLEELAPHVPVDQARRGRVAQPHWRGRLSERTGRRRASEAERNHQLRVMGREVVVAATDGRLDFGPWEQIFSGQASWLARES